MRLDLEAHPAATLFPLFDEKELAALADDIRKHGLLEPITLHEGKILDGRNRLLACDRAGVEPTFAEWDGASGSPTLWVVSKNRHRRHLTPGQVAMLANDMLPLLEAEAAERAKAARSKTSKGSEKSESPVSADTDLVSKGVAGRSREIAAKAVGVSPASVSRAKALKKASPKLAAEVAAGTKPLKTALREAKEKKAPKPDADAPIVDAKGHEIPAALRPEWDAMTGAVEAFLSPLRAAQAAYHDAYLQLGKFPSGTSTLAQNLNRVLGHAQKNIGTAVEPRLRHGSPKLQDLIDALQMALPYMVCVHCKGAKVESGKAGEGIICPDCRGAGWLRRDQREVSRHRGVA